MIYSYLLASSSCSFFYFNSVCLFLRFTQTIASATRTINIAANIPHTMPTIKGTSELGTSELGTSELSPGSYSFSILVSEEEDSTRLYLGHQKLVE